MNNRTKRVVAGVVIVLLALIIIMVAAQQDKHDRYPEETKDAVKEMPWGTYTAFLPAASTPGRTLILQLNVDATHSATLTHDYKNNKPVIVQSGTWEDRNLTGLVIVTLPQKDGVLTAKPEVLTFIYEDNKLSLTGYDATVWGAEGLTLSRSDLALESEWAWVETETKDAKITPEGTLPFILKLAGNGKVNVQGDCNTLMGAYHLDADAKMTVSILASTRKACQGSQEQQFMTDINKTASYEVRGNMLHLEMANDAGTMVFARRLKQN
jgi:heat shock protein HslJ